MHDESAIQAEGVFWRRAHMQVTSFRVTDEESFARAGELVRGAKTAHATLDARRKEITEPLLKAKRSTDDLFRPPLQALQDIEKHLRAEIVRYTSEQLAQRAAIVHVSSALASAGVVPTAIVPERPTAEGVTVVQRWAVRVLDAAAVPRDMCSPDESKLLAACGAIEAPPPDVPGVEFYLEGRSIVRR